MLASLLIFNPKNWSRKSPKVYVTIQQFHSVSISGACDMKVENLVTSKQFTAKCSGASDISMQLKVDQLTCNLSGASDMKLSGSADIITVKASGASDFKAKNFSVQECNAQASGASDIFVNVEKKLTYRTSGASDIHYEGTPAVYNLKEKKSKEIRP